MIERAFWLFWSFWDRSFWSFWSGAHFAIDLMVIAALCFVFACKAVSTYEDWRYEDWREKRKRQLAQCSVDGTALRRYVHNAKMNQARGFHDSRT